LSQSLSDEEWREDLIFIEQAIREHHPNPFYVSLEENFQDMMENLNKNLPDLEDHEILSEMSRIVASLHDGHTAIRGGFQFLTGQYPFDLYYFEDGIFVIGASADLADIIGAKLISIDQNTAEDVFTAVTKVTPHDNEMTLKERTPDLMMSPEVLHSLGITPVRDRAHFTFLSRDDYLFTVNLAPRPFDTIRFSYDTSVGTNPLSRRNRGRNYWHQYIESSKTLYVQYNSVRDAADESIKDYFGRVAQIAATSDIERVVLDLRFNGGGNDFLNRPVAEWVESSPLVIQGRFFVIIGRGTYSAAQKLVTRLEASGVVLVGEPTGGSPNHFGDAIELRLPNSGITLTVSKIFHTGATGETRRTINPDVPVPVFSNGYFTGRDAALELIQQ